MSATTSSSSSSNSSIPALFRCPISLELMKDPVTLCTGVTYDRSSIERWLQEGHVTCPTTMQPLETLDLTPNHTLRRLIQGWCSTHKLVSAGPADDQAINQAVSALRSNPLSISDLKSLTCLLKYNEQNRAFMASSGAQNALLHTLCKAPTGSETALEALAILAQLPIQEECIQSMPKKALDALSFNLCNSAISVSSRIHAAEVLSRILTADEGLRFNFRPDQEVFSSVAAMMGSAKSSSPQSAFVKSSIKTALDLLLLISPVRRNRVRVVEAGIVGVLIEAALTDEADRILTEKGLALLELVCQCAEGRAAVCGHPLGIHLLVKKIARVSEAATDSATFALWHIYKNCRTASVLRELDEAGAYTKLFLLLQIGCGSATRRKAKDILRDHKNTRCDRNPCFLAANQTNNHPATMQGLAKLF